MSPLALLDKLDEFRRKHQNTALHPVGWCMRFMETIVAKTFGFQSRDSWTAALKEDVSSRYHQALWDPAELGF